MSQDASVSSRLVALNERLASYPGVCDSQPHAEVAAALPELALLAAMAENYIVADKRYQRRMDTRDIQDALNRLAAKLGEPA